MERDFSHYEFLSQRINEIIENFAFKNDPLEPPSEKEEDLIRAMIVLCHAEFEDYLEGLASRIIEHGKLMCIKQGVANRNIASLFLNSDKFKNDPKLREMDIRSYAMKQIADFAKSIQEGNHGIKSKNIENMYIPLGFSLNDFSQDFLNELDQFGYDRGKIAHLSRNKTREILDYNNEKSKILHILAEIDNFEKIIYDSEKESTA